MTTTVTTSAISATIRKAAILVANLDTQSADALLERMPPDQAALVRRAVMQLDDIPLGEQEKVIRQFMDRDEPREESNNDGVELDLSLAKKIASSSAYESTAVEPPPSKLSPFQSLSQANPAALVRQLERQHPQVVAVVVAHLPPKYAADVVTRLDPRLQSDVLRRVAELDRADPDVIREIESELEQLLTTEIEAAQNRDAGLSTVAAILLAAGNDRSGLLENLASHEHQLADLLARHPTLSEHSRLIQATSREVTSGIQSAHAAPPPFEINEARQPAHPMSHGVLPPVAKPGHQTQSERVRGTTIPINTPRPQTINSPRNSKSSSNGLGISKSTPNRSGQVPTGPSIEFEDLASLSDTDWASLIHAVDPPVMLLALAGASEMFLQRITAKLTPKEAQELLRRLEQTGPVRLADIDHAQQRVVQHARRLASEGLLQTAPSRKFAAAA